MTVATPVSPKVKFSALWGSIAAIGSTVVLGAANALTPGLFSGLGAYGPLIEGAVVLGATSLAGYLSKDALREQGQAALNAGATPTTAVKPAEGTAIPATETPAAGSTTFGTDTTSAS